MTSNQINYAKVVEDTRHNKVSEAETQRHNIAGEQFNLSSLAEVARHNVATEQETTRHNVATEEFNLSSLAEVTRHNKASESIGWHQAQSSRISANAAWANAQAAQFNADTNRLRQQEDVRHNMKTESQRGEEIGMMKVNSAVDNVTKVTNSIARVIDAVIPL